MSTTLKALYGANGQAITITLASLASGSARQSTVIDNSSNLFVDAFVFVMVESGTVSGNKQVVLYVYGTADGGTTYTENATGTDGAITVANPTLLRPLAVIPLPSNATVYRAGPFSVAQAFGGSLPDHWGLVANNDSGAALSATAGNNKAFYQGVQYQGV